MDITQTLLRNNSQIKHLYKSYLSRFESGLGENAYCMDMKICWCLLKEAKILDHNCTLAAVNRLFLQGYKNVYHLTCDQDQLDNQIQYGKTLHRQITNQEFRDIDFLDFLKKINQSAEINYRAFSQQTEQFLKENQSNFVSINKRASLLEVHNPARIVLPRHFVEFIVRACFVKSGTHENLSRNFENMLLQKLMPVVDQTQVKMKSIHSYSQDQDDGDHFHQKIKKAQDTIQPELKITYNLLLLAEEMQHIPLY